MTCKWTPSSKSSVWRLPCRRRSRRASMSFLSPAIAPTTLIRFARSKRRSFQPSSEARSPESGSTNRSNESSNSSATPKSWTEGGLHQGQSAEVIGIVCSSQRPRLEPGACHSVTSAANGQWIETVAPCPGPSLVASTDPPCASTMVRVIARPKPVPRMP